jgi:hypothetical protein
MAWGLWFVLATVFFKLLREYRSHHRHRGMLQVATGYPLHLRGGHPRNQLGHLPVEPVACTHQFVPRRVEGAPPQVLVVQQV